MNEAPERVTVGGVEYVRAYPVAPRRCAHCGNESRAWTAPLIVAAFLRWFELYGVPPASTAWHVARDGFPSSNVVIRYFGSWDAGVRAAGLPALPRGGQLYWTRERILAAMASWAAEHGKAPTLDAWRHSAPDRPSARTVTNRFGSWNAALDAAGFYKRGPYGVRLRETLPKTPEKIGLVNARPIADLLRAELCFRTAKMIAADVGIDDSYISKIVSGKSPTIRADFADLILTKLDRPDLLEAARVAA